MNSNVFIRKIKNILSDNKVDRYEKNKKKGKIDNKKLYRHKFSNKFFKQKIIRSNKEYYISFYLDLSGSMMNTTLYKNENVTRFQAMSDTVHELINSFMKIKGINIRVIFYSHDVLVYKDYYEDYKNVVNEIDGIFAEELRKYELYKERGEDSLPFGLKNKHATEYTNYLIQDYPDNYILKIRKKGSEKIGKSVFKSRGTYIIPALKLFPPVNDNEISFIVSDGEFNEDVKQVTNVINRLKGEVFGIGIAHHTIINYFGFRKSAVIYSVEDMYNLVSEKLSKVIARR